MKQKFTINNEATAGVAKRIFLTAVMLCMMLPMALMAQFSGGTGTVSNPYQITTINQLAALADYVNDGNGAATADVYYKLMNDLDMSDWTTAPDALGWMPIGRTSSATQFRGNFNGAGHKVTGLWINRSTSDDMGLFGYIAGASIDSLGVEVAAAGIRGYSTVGGLVGNNSSSSTITNCYVTGTGTITGFAYAGGLAGGNTYSSTISNCYATVNVAVIGIGVAGGLVGANLYSNPTISNCYATGNVSGTYSGGLVGDNNTATIQDCVAANDAIIGTPSNRMVGYSFGGSTYTDNYANEAMTVNGATVTTGAHNNVNGEDKPLSTFNSFNFYNSSENWNGGAWSIDKVENDGKAWRICDKKNLPYLQWQEEENPCTEPFCGGTGTATDPYMICTPGQLDAVRYFLDAHFMLANDITLTNEWEPIGDNDEPFTGSFDGDGYSIIGLKVTDAVYIGESLNSPQFAYSAGLFAVLDRAEVSNLTFESPVIEIDDISDATYTFGTIAGMSFGSQIRNVIVNEPTILSIVGNWAALFFGGVVGYAYESDLPNSAGLTMNIINGTEVYGGEIGITDFEGYYADRSYCYLGGIAGANYKGVIVNAAVYGTAISADSHIPVELNDVFYAGGIVGYTSAEDAAEEAFCLLNNIAMAQLNIDAGITTYYPDNYGVGGICGFLNQDAAVNNIYISGQSYDIFGQEKAEDYTVSHNYKYANVSAANADNILNKLNDKTPTTGGFWAAAKVIDDDTGYGFEEAMKKLKGWIHKTILGTPETPYLGAYYEPSIFCGGTGTATAPYQICTIDDLAFLAEYVNDGNGTATAGVYYKLMNDIDMSDWTTAPDALGWMPIGRIVSIFDFSRTFQGNFNGAGHKVTGLWINRSTSNDIGLFGYIRDASIDSLGVEVATAGIKGYNTVGGLVGNNNNGSTITNCYVIGTGTITSSQYAGGLAGGNTNGSTISNCYATVNATITGAANYAGGLAGGNLYDNATISNCYATGNVNGMFSGGLVGNNNSAIIKDCVAANDAITGTASNRMVGSSGGASTLTNNYANEAMTVNGAIVSTGAHNNVNGEDKDMETFITFDFYNTAGNWSGGVWDICAANGVCPVAVWKICDTKALPHLRWQGIECDDDDVVTGVEIKNCPENGWLFLHDNLQMEVQVLPPTATNQNVIWFSTNPNTATVDQNGLVTAERIGATVIKATTVDGGFVTECFIRVISPVSGVTLNKSTTILAVGGIETLKATVYPENASVKDVKWSSANEGVATVVDGKVTAIADGTTTITVTTMQDGYTATCVVTVVTAYITPTGITMTPTTLNLDRGKSHPLKADVKPAGANPLVTWSSSNTTIATVDDDGIVTAKAAGKVTITAKTVNGLGANCAVTVTIPVESIEVTPEDCTLALKGTKALKAIVYPSDATNKTIVWSSSNTAVATVNTSGTVTAKANGVAEIYATNTASGEVGICIVTVG
ncbi:MAG: Ig-like domain-containing protein, partial [Bacteroidales bacterium]|nr:Ig-like domain-containing protein [Bacteroidales bacterium]